METDNPTSSADWTDGIDLSTDNWLLQAQWKARACDDLNRCTFRLAECMNALATLSPSLTEWYWNDQHVPISESILKEWLSRNWDSEGPHGQLGTTLSLWNGVKDDQGIASFSVTCGSTTDTFQPGFDFKPPVPAAWPGLYRVDAMLQVFEILLSAWEPAWSRIQPLSLDDASEGEMINALASWIIYLEPDVYSQTGTLPEEVQVVDSTNGRGSFFILAPTPEQIHLSTVERLRECLVFPEDWALLR
ncbi:Imm52 family immunity protein [Haloglycomyces albus]|uniref:Imm52 family immunity protein n=1 Tax=Haloglycomyces albus TaxID=526067 RepID=UPI00046CF733|nr:Imm52 family immunity protein [Haloglycomyces albus]